MADWYCSLESVKRAGSIHTSDNDARLARLIEGASRDLSRTHRRRYIPETVTKLYRWPTRGRAGRILWLLEDLISITTLQSKAQDSSPTTIAATDYFLEPQQYGPPYDRIEIDLSSTAAFESGDTPQRSISILGSWGYKDDTRSVGTVASGLDSDATATSMISSDSSVIDVGDTLLIESEQIFVTARTYVVLSLTTINDANVIANMANQTITLDASHGVVAGEIIRLEAEEIFVVSVSTNDLTVIRAYNGSVLAVHADNTPVHTNRTLTIERAVNGTTGATHADNTAISKYEPPFDIVNQCVGEVLSAFSQEISHWGRSIGSGDGAVEVNSRDLAARRKELLKKYQRVRERAI